MKKLSHLFSVLLASVFGLQANAATENVAKLWRKFSVKQKPVQETSELMQKLAELPPTFSMTGTDLVELGFDENLVEYLLWNHGKTRNLENPILVNRHDETKTIDLSNFDRITVTVPFEQLADVLPNVSGWEN